MTKQSQDEQSKRLAELWQTRASFTTEKQWEELYKLVYKILNQMHSKEITKLEQKGENKKDLIVRFFTDKVYYGNPENTCNHSGALRRFFINYLIDQLKSINTKKQKITFSENSQLENDENNKNDKNYSFLDNPENGYLDKYVESLSSDNYERLLKEYSLTKEKIVKRFLLWFKLFSIEDQYWILPYLAYCHCAENQEKISLLELSKRYAISSHHYKAKKLESWLKEHLESYHLTLPEDMEMAKIILQIICEQSLILMKQAKNNNFI